MVAEVVESLGDLLREAGFGQERHFALLRTPGGVPPAEALAVLDRREDARLAVLLALFSAGQSVPQADVEQAIAPFTDQLLDVGLLEVNGAGLRSQVRLSAIGGLIVAGDTRRASSEPDYLVPLTPAGKALAYTTVRRRVETALDVCTGSGIQALLAARHAERVTAVDSSRHALSRARLSQQLNGLHNIELVDGEWFEPVEGQRFDLVVANPPVVVSPEPTVVAGQEMSAEDLFRKVIRDSAQHLGDGGFATVLCNWGHPAGRWENVPRQWVRDLGCDAVVLNLGTQEPLAYALANGVGPRGVDAETIERWMRHYDAAGVEQISGGVVVLRGRSGGPNWVRAFEAQGDPSGPGSDQLERMFAGGDFLLSAAGPDEHAKVLAGSWRLSDGHRLDQSLVSQNGAYPLSQAVLRHEPGLHLVAEVDGRMVPMLAGLDGARPLATVLEHVPVPEGIDRSGFHNLAVETVKDLIARGFLVGS